MSKIFKECPACSHVWDTRSDFLADPNVRLKGYQVHFQELSEGLFLFNHECLGTFALSAGAFEDLYEGPVFQEKATGTDQCPGHCLHQSELEPCPSHCECAYVREVMQIVRNWPRQT